MANSKKSDTFAAAAAASGRCLESHHTQNLSKPDLCCTAALTKLSREIHTSGHARTWNFFDHGQTVRNKLRPTKTWKQGKKPKETEGIPMAF